jgi:hypothetical protein
MQPIVCGADVALLHAGGICVALGVALTYAAHSLVALSFALTT